MHRPASGLEGHYRFVLTGSDHIQVKVLITQVFDFPQLEGMELFGQFVPGHQIALQRNATTSGWVDVGQLVQAQDLDVFDKNGQPAHDAFLDFMEHTKAQIPHAGNYLLYYNKLHFTNNGN
jgi:hypothetical protein